MPSYSLILNLIVHVELITCSYRGNKLKLLLNLCSLEKSELNVYAASETNILLFSLQYLHPLMR